MQENIRLKGRFRLGSVNTIKNYISCRENNWLIFKLNIHDYSIKRQQFTSKKIYGIDLGLINAIGFQIFPNAGREIRFTTIHSLSHISTWSKP